MTPQEQRRYAKKAFQDLHLLGGAAASNADSPSHRAMYAKSAERWDLAYWAAHLTGRETALAAAIVGAIVALSQSECEAQRGATSLALSALVKAARTNSPLPPPKRVVSEPRLYWVNER